MKNIQSIFNLRNLVSLLISLAVGALIYVAFGFYKSFNLYNSVDGLFIAAACLICIGLMYWIINAGTFDGLTVGFSNLFAVQKKNGTKKYDSIFDYRETKAAKRASNRFSFLPIVFAGFLYLVAALIVYAVFKANY